MSNQVPAFGLTAEAQAKQAAKLDPAMEAEVRRWIEAVSGASLQADTMEALKDGVVLCNLINKIKPGSVKNINSSKMAFKQMENINNFLIAAQSIGCRQTDLFATVDLFEAKDKTCVIQAIDSVGRQAQKWGFKGPVLGAKVATAQPRNFTEDVLNAGKAVPSAQMGYNKGATQAGMTAPGNRREIDHLAHNNLR